MLLAAHGSDLITYDDDDTLTAKTNFAVRDANILLRYSLIGLSPEIVLFRRSESKHEFIEANFNGVSLIDDDLVHRPKCTCRYAVDNTISSK
jgi:hypothetical protein